MKQLYSWSHVAYDYVRSPLEYHANGPCQKEVEKIHIYCLCIVSYRDMEFENETRASGKLRGTIILDGKADIMITEIRCDC